MKLLDLFCGAGGAGMGYHRAGFEVVGVDIKPQKHYPFEFHCADAFAFLEKHGHKFDVIHASPPCQAHTILKGMWNAKTHQDFIPATRTALRAFGRPYVIENVVGAPLNHPVLLCGTMFGLATPCGAELRRHRLFECSEYLGLTPKCFHSKRGVVGVYGGHVRDRRRTITVTGSTPQMNVVTNVARETFTVNAARIAMGIDWMPMSTLSQAIPPAYTEWIGRQLFK